MKQLISSFTAVTVVLLFSLSFATNTQPIQHKNQTSSYTNTIKKGLAKLIAFTKFKNSASTNLNDLEKYFRYRQHIALLKIKKTFNIPDEPWQQCMKGIELVKKYNKNISLKTTHSNVIHDSNLPNNLLEITKRLLHENDINPASVSIKNKVEHKNLHTHTDTTNIIGCAQAPITTINNISKLLQGDIKTTIKQNEPACIFLSKNEFNEMKPEHQYANIAHEVTHLVEDHGTELSGILYLLKLYGYDKDQIIKHPVWLAYSRTIETNANILPALKNPKIARYMKSLWGDQCKIIHPKVKKVWPKTHPSPLTLYVHLCRIVKCH